MQFFGVQLVVDDNREGIAELVLRKAEELGFRCKALELLDVMDLGSFKYVRFRIDFDVPTLTTLVNAIFDATSRNVILPGGIGGYRCRMKGREGIVPYSKMQLASREHPKVYRGNGIVNWERQFLKDGGNGG